MAVKEPGWILEAPGKRKMEKEDENGDDSSKSIGHRRPIQGLRNSKFSKLIIGNIIVVIGTNLIFFVF